MPKSISRSGLNKLRLAMLACALSATWGMASAFDSGGTGADGALNPTVNTEIQLPASGILNYASINIPTGVKVTFKKNALNTPVYLLVSGNASIAGTIDISASSAKHVGTAGDGNQADDGLPGIGGPGGYDGGRGGKDGALSSGREGGAGRGPGGGKGGIEGADYGCSSLARYYPRIGGGAGYSTYGTESTSANSGYGCPNSRSDAVGKPYGSTVLQPLVGGSGGGGGRGGLNYPGSGGGGGGGAILLAVSGTLNLTGLVIANGGGAGLGQGLEVGDSGGGGSGGAIRVLATSFSGNGALRAAGACVDTTGTTSASQGVKSGDAGYNFPGSYQYYFSACHTNGAAEGRIRVEADNITYTGASFPAYTTDVPGPIFLANVPTLRIASIGGQAVPANPTGNADLTFPANLSNPVTVQLATTNVPTGNIIEVKVIPAYGNTQDVISPAITGSNASGQASVQVNLPQGPSVIQAVTTYTVIVAMGESLSRYAQNERVEKVQLFATLGQSENQAKLITITGKEYIVPASVLQMVGFKG